MQGALRNLKVAGPPVSFPIRTLHQREKRRAGILFLALGGEISPSPPDASKFKKRRFLKRRNSSPVCWS
jgi:hypothetical protein